MNPLYSCSRRRPAPSSQRGFSMIEVLVTLLIVALAMLGAVGLQMQSMRTGQGGQFRAQAVFLAGDLAERMEANKAAAVAGAYVVATSSTPTASANPCTALVCLQDQLADNDLAQWERTIVQTLPQASWSVTQTTAGNPSTYTIVISWVDRRTGATYEAAGTGETFSFTATRTVYSS
jgi:type IV pilus assembly protein PilV